MKEYLQPLWIFLGGNLLLLIAFIFFPAIGEAQTSLTAETASVAGDIWGWSWVMASVRVIVFVFIEGLILFGVAKSILGLKK